MRIYTSGLYIRVVRNNGKSAAAALFGIAEEQQGCFTAKQATDAGYLLGSQAHHVKAGNWIRVERGIYRLVRFPQSAEEQLVIYSLWSRNRRLRKANQPVNASLDTYPISGFDVMRLTAQ